MSAALPEGLITSRLRKLGAVGVFFWHLLAQCGPALGTSPAHRQPDLQRRRTLFGHHHALGPVRRDGARTAGF